MPVPREIEQWVSRNYPKPRIDPEWLEECYNYLIGELNIPANDVKAITENIESQFLQSDLRDSTVANSGLPKNVANMHAIPLPPFVLLQVVSCTEIGSSAFQLQNARQAWLEKSDLAGLAGGEEGVDEPVGEYPRYPRGMLSLELSDGYISVKGVEYRKLPELQLGQVPLGFKIVLKSVPMRRGVALLQPSNVELRGCQNDELDAHRDAVFVRGLRKRMGLPEQNGDAEGAQRENAQHAEPNDQPAPADAANVHAPGGSPLRDRRSNPPSRSPYFPQRPPSIPVRLSPLPFNAGAEQEFGMNDDTFDFGDDELDEGFLEQLERAEREAVSQASQGPNASTASQTNAVGVIEIDSDEEKENQPARPAKRARRAARTEVIELSD